MFNYCKKIPFYLSPYISVLQCAVGFFLFIYIPNKTPRHTLWFCETPPLVEPKIIIHNIWKGWSELQGYSQWAVFTLISCHIRILSRGEITWLSQTHKCSSALFFMSGCVRIKTRLERHLLLKYKLRIDSRENRDAFGRSQNRSTNRFCIVLSSQP